MTLALWLLLIPQWAEAASTEHLPLQVLHAVEVREFLVRGEQIGLKLTFPSVGPDPRLARPLSVQEARALVAALEAEFKAPKERYNPSSLVTSLFTTSLTPRPSWKRELLGLEKRVRDGYLQLYGPPLAGFPLPDSLESAKWFQALKLSPKHMSEGLREAAVELFSSPTFSLSVGFSLMLYGLAWMNPEPLISKGFAVAVTLVLLTTYTVAELYNVGQAFLRLYREAEMANSAEELEAVAQRFARAMSGVALRIVVSLAGARLTSALPKVPPGGLRGMNLPSRFAYSGVGRSGFTTGSKASAQVSVADGTVVLMGVTANTTAAAVAAAYKARSTGGCAESKKPDNQRHHICTDKNNSAETQGGPWTPPFQELFNRAGMSLQDPANLIFLINHQGPHPEEYHEEVFQRLLRALGNCRTTTECRQKLVGVLDEIAAEICNPGSRLNKLATK